MTTPEQALLDARARAEARRFYESQTLQDNKDTYAQGSGLGIIQAKAIVTSLFDTKFSTMLIDGPATITMSVGDVIDLDAFLLYRFENLPRINRDMSATWISSTPATATIDQGLVTAVAPGTTNITASEGSFTSNTIIITVV